MDIHHFSVLLCLLSWAIYESCSGRRTHRRRGKVSNLSAQKNPNLLWTQATPFWKSEYCNIAGCSSLYTHNPADQIGGMPWKEGGGPLSKLLSGGDTSTNSLYHPIPNLKSKAHFNSSQLLVTDD